MYKNLNKYQNGTGFIPTKLDKMNVAPEYAFPGRTSFGASSGERSKSEIEQVYEYLLANNPDLIQDVINQAKKQSERLGMGSYALGSILPEPTYGFAKRNPMIYNVAKNLKNVGKFALNKLFLPLEAADLTYNLYQGTPENNLVYLLGKGVSYDLPAWMIDSAVNTVTDIAEEDPEFNQVQRDVESGNTGKAYHDVMSGFSGVVAPRSTLNSSGYFGFYKDGSELDKAQEGSFEDQPLYQSLQNYLDDPERAKLVAENPLIPAAEEYIYGNLLNPSQFIEDDSIPLDLMAGDDGVIDANDLRLITTESQRNLQKANYDPSKTKTFKEYGQDALRLLGNLGRGARNVFARNPLGLLVANTIGEAYDYATTGELPEPSPYMQMLTGTYGQPDENQIYAYGDEIRDLVTPQKNPNIQNIYEGDDRFTISKMEREKEKTDKLFQEQQEYLYDESGFLNPNLDLSKNPLRNKKYTLYNPYSEDMLYDPMNPTKLFTETEYGEYQDDMITKRTMAVLNQRAEMYPELFQKVTDFDPETKEITYAGDMLEGDLFSDANPDATYLQYTTPEGEESGSFTGSLVSDAEGDITAPIYDPFDLYENDEGTYTFMEAEAKYGGIPKYQRAGAINRLINFFRGADKAADVTKVANTGVSKNEILQKFLQQGDNLENYNEMISRRFKIDLNSPLSRQAIINYKTKFPPMYGASEEIGGGFYGLIDDITKRSNLLDDYIAKNPGYKTSPEDFTYLGNKSGRQIVSVDTPVGTQYFYKSSGLAGKEGSKDMWIPFEGFADDSSKAFNTGSDDWFMKQGSVGTYKGVPIETSPDGKIGVRQKLINMGVDPMEALRSGDLILDQPGWDFMYTQNPNAFYNKLSNQLDRITQEKGWGVLNKETRAHGGPHTEEEWEEWRQQRENYQNNNMSNESVGNEFNYYDSIAPGSYDPSIMDNMFFADEFEEKIEEDTDDEFEFADPNKPVMSVKDEERKPRDFNFEPFEALVTGLGAVNQILENRPKDFSVNQLAMNQFQEDTRDNRGFYDVNTGILNPDRNIVERQAAYGGRTDQLRNRQYDDIDTTIELDEGTIQELIAAGAEIDIL